MAILIPYKAGSASAKVLAEALGIRRLNVNNNRTRTLNHSTLINWGNSSGRVLDHFGECTVWNSPEKVANASCKRRSFEVLGEAGVSIPEVFTSRQEAAQALTEGNNTNNTNFSTSPAVLLSAP